MCWRFWPCLNPRSAKRTQSWLPRPTQQYSNIYITVYNNIAPLNNIFQIYHTTMIPTQQCISDISHHYETTQQCNIPHHKIASKRYIFKIKRFLVSKWLDHEHLLHIWSWVWSCNEIPMRDIHNIWIITGPKIFELSPGWYFTNICQNHQIYHRQIQSPKILDQQVPITYISLILAT